MQNSATKKDWQIFFNVLYVTGAFLLLVIAVATYFNFQTLLEKDYWVDHTNQVIFTAEKELSLLKDAETGTRGYIISRDSAYLEPYFDARDSVAYYLRQLTELTKDNPSQQNRMPTLRRAIQERHQLFEQVVTLKNNNQTRELEQFFSLHKGKASMDQVRALLREVVAEENRLLSVRSREFNESVQNTRGITFLIVIASLLVDGLLFATLRRGLRQKARYEKTLQDKNQQLEGFNQELAASNEELNTLNEELMAAQENLSRLNNELEERVRERTEELQKAHQEVILLLEREKVARLEAIQQGERFHQLIESLPVMAWTADSEGNRYYFNRRWFEYSGATFEQLKGWGWQEFVHPDDRPHTLKIWREAVQSGNVLELTDRRQRADGMYRWHLIRSFPLRNAVGEVVLWVGTATDIQDLKEAEEELRAKNEELERTNQDLDNFVYTASHDLKSPIVNVEGLAKLLRKRLLEKITAKEEELFNMIDHAVGRLKRTIQDLAEIARINKEVETEDTPVQFGEVLQEVMDDIHSMQEEAAAVVTTDFAVPRIGFAHKHIRSILYNLVSNALKYRDPQRETRIHLKSRQVDTYTVLSIQDNGLGLSNEQLGKLFTLFKRFHMHVEGTGIGLYIVKRILENHGGKIEVESKLGEGTTFYLYFKTAANLIFTPL